MAIDLAIPYLTVLFAKKLLIATKNLNHCLLCAILCKLDEQCAPDLGKKCEIILAVVFLPHLTLKVTVVQIIL